MRYLGQLIWYKTERAFGIIAIRHGSLLEKFYLAFRDVDVCESDFPQGGMWATFEISASPKIRPDDLPKAIRVRLFKLYETAEADQSAEVLS